MTNSPVTVRYERSLPPFMVGRWIMQAVTREGIDMLRRGVETGRIEEVVLVGPNVATGWRVGVNRAVNFQERPTVDENDANAQRQASMRIVSTLEKTT